MKQMFLDAKRFALTAAGCLSVFCSHAELSVDAGRWHVGFSEKENVLKIDNAALRFSMEGSLAFESEGKKWR